MSDNMRRFRAVQSFMDLHGNPTGRMRQHVTVLALFISGVVGSKSVHASDAAKKKRTWSGHR